MSSFTTEFGHKIEFVPGYFEANKKYNAHVDASDHAFDAELRTFSGGKRWDFWHPAKDYVNLSAIIYFLRRHQVLQNWERGIDLGGAEGASIALMKAAGYIKHATNSDIYDYSPVIGPGYFRSFIEFLSTVYESESEEAMQTRKIMARTRYSFDYFPQQGAMTGLLNSFPHSAEIDVNLHGNMMDLNEQYDFVMSCGVFEHLDLDQVLAKVSALLSRGGTFACMDGYWWFPVNSAGFVGHFPYMLQRLSASDLERYMTGYHPEAWPALRKRYSHINGGKLRPTISDWIALGHKHCLRTVAVERIMPARHHRIPEVPAKLFRQPYFDPSEVLRDIAAIRDGVVIEDLMTSALRIAMVKI